MYPLKFEKILKEKVWGGRKFDALLNIPLPTEDNYGESWEISSHGNGMSVVQNGKFRGQTLMDLINQYGNELLGDDVTSRYNGKFPLLIKYLDINDKLSVQVHPSDDYALRVEGEFGKYESWYVVEASEDAKLILGMKDGISAHEFKSRVEKGDFNDMFNIVPVKQGDFLDVKPGLVHASVEGSIVICEVQQNSDTTYRIYDFDREVDGVRRELHLDKSMDVIDFSLKPNISSENSRISREIAGGTIEDLSRNDIYSIDRIKLEKGAYTPDVYKNFKIISVIAGEGSLDYNSEKQCITYGDTYLIPAGLDFCIKGSVEVLESYITIK